MEFHKIPTFTSQELIDVAFRRSSIESRKYASAIRGEKIKKVRKIEEKKVEIAAREIKKRLNRILNRTPYFHRLPEFYRRLVSLLVDLDRAKKSLGAVKWAVQRVNSLERNYRGKIRASQDIEEMKKLRREFFGRVASVLKQISQELDYIGEMRHSLREIPVLKEEFTVVIAGMPNTGKSTLLKAITGAEPEIASYPFTTKKLLLGYLREGSREVQIIDTPGLLDRDIEKMNPLEKQAVLALELVANIIFYIIDPSETCGFTLDSQINLLNTIKRNFSSEIVAVVNKVDLCTEDVIREVEGKLHIKTFRCSALHGRGVEELKRYILEVSQNKI